MPLLPERAGLSRFEEELGRMSLLEHLEELRKRILWSLLSLAIAFVPCWAFREPLIAFLSAPIHKVKPDLKLAFLGVTDPFIMYFKVTGLAAVFLAAPFILLQVWRFVAPGLYKREKMYAVPFIMAGSLFFLAGGAFGYYVAFPKAIDFLLGMGEQFEPVITIERYFGFLITVILGLGLMFELPILILILCMIGIISPRFLLRQWRVAVILIFIVAAIVTPTPDVANLLIFAVPACALYFLGVAAAFVLAPQKAE